MKDSAYLTTPFVLSAPPVCRKEKREISKDIRGTRRNLSNILPTEKHERGVSKEVRKFLHLAALPGLAENEPGGLKVLRISTGGGKLSDHKARTWLSALGFMLMLAVLFAGPISSGLAFAQGPAAWPQWGQNPQHTGYLTVAGQALQGKLSDQIFDPFTSQEMAESRGSLLMHYQVPLVNGPTVFMEFKTGTYVSCNPPGSGQPAPCGPNAWSTEIWSETNLQWQHGQLVPVWNFASDTPR